MNVHPLQRALHAADLPLDRLVANPNIPEAEKVKEVARQFEAVLLRQILQQARHRVFQSDLETDSTARSIYDDLLNHQLAEAISRSGAFGLANALERQLIRQVLPASAEGPTQNPTEPTRPSAPDAPPAL
jgi:Rod binding domain-containing protein